MRRGVPTVPPELTLTALVHDYLVRSDEHTMPVVRDGHLLGLVSLADVRGVAPSDWSVTPVSQVMQTGDAVAVAKPDESVAQAVEELGRRNIEQVAVLDHGNLVGMFQRRDVARWLELGRGPVGAT